MSNYSIINSRAPRIDAPDKATGRALYIDDIRLPNMLFGALLQSPLAHARIVRIDTSKAKSLPGVKAVITAEDTGMVQYGVSPARYDETLFCSDKVRYVGDEIAAVAAVDLETAMKAASLIDVEYEELPVLLTIDEAIAEGVEPIHDKYPRNIGAEVHQEFGNVEEALAECDLVRTDTFQSKKQDCAAIEPHGCIAEYDRFGYLTLRTSTQVPHYVQRTLAMVTKLPVGKVRVIKYYVGGGFGCKAAANPLELSASLLSMKTGKPVKMIYTREQVFQYARGRHQFTHTLTTGVKKDGTIVALKNECYLDGGAYSSFGIATVYYAGSLLGGPYRLQNMKYDGYRVYTNKPACGAQRGHGGVIARAAWEQQLDIIAEELGMDPMDLRLRNIMVKGDTSCNALYMSSLGMRECVETVKEKSGWEKKWGKLPKGKGIGMACGFFVSGAGYPIYRSDTYHATASVKLSEDGGTAHLYTASAEIGQGSDTTFAMITAEALGIPLDWVRVSSGDTDFGVDLGAYSSRQTLMTGHAVKEAAEDAKRQVLEVLADELKVPEYEMDVRDGLIIFQNGLVDFRHLRNRYIGEHRGWTDNPQDDLLTFKEAARIAYLAKGTIIGKGEYRPRHLGGEYKGATVGTSPAYGCSAQVVEVSVDMETGQITVERMTDAHDCGFAINRTSVEAQIQGNLSMGLGEAMFEQVKFDPKGHICNPNFAEYKIPTALDMPTITPVIVESHEPYGPYGAKEVGEGGIIPTIPAILNAVYDATGIRFQELPLTPERVFMALRNSQRKRNADTKPE
jgi:4-hydroxybenzoyl-CoA reductase subunit alpha